jgi:hypothetical protein
MVREDAERRACGKAPRVAVGRASGATSSQQARYFAANGENAEEFGKRKGRKKATYRDPVRYAVVETRVLEHLYTMAEIEWNLDKVRRGLYGRFGDEILWHLCGRFDPKEPAPGSEAALSANLRKKKTLSFRIVDLDEFRANVAKARLSIRGKRTTIRVHEGQLLKRATMTAHITANASWRALQIYRERVQGTMSVLPHGMFIAILEQEWDDMIARQTLPAFYTGNEPVGMSGQTKQEEAEPLCLTPSDDVADNAPPPRKSRTRTRLIRRSKHEEPEQQKLPFGA